jgi:hypothetical protein
MWVLPNRFFFTNWFYNKFHPSKYIPDEQEKRRTFSPDASQKLIRDYIHYDSPYRGVLVYFGLGTGKTCASIMATDSFVHRHKKVVVILPSSLENNYRKELNKCSTTGGMLRKYWNYIELNLVKDLSLIDQIMKQYGFNKAFITELNGKLWLPYLPVDFPADKIKKAQVHMSAMSEEDQKLAQHIYQTILDNRYTFIHYNGINNKHLDKLEVKDDYGEDAFDNAIIVIDEVHTFISRVVNGGKIARRLYNLLISKPNIRLVLLSGTPVINNPFELCYTLNLLRGPMEEYSTSALKNKFLPPLYEIIEHLGPLYRHIDMLELDATNTHLKFTLLPNGFVRKDNGSVELEKGPYYKDEKQLADKIMRLLKDKIPINARYKTSEYTALPNKLELFNEYFLDTSDPDNPRVKQENMELFLRRIQGIVSYYRIADEEKFPKALPPILKPVEMSGHQFQYYAEVRNKEIQQDDFQKKYRKKDADLFKTNSSYRAYSRMACNFVFPEEIPRPFPKEIRAKILRKEIDIAEEDEEEEEDEKLSVQVAKLYEQEVKDTLAKLQQKSEMYLQGDGLRNYSPKMATFLDDIEKHGQVKSLVYSQFRTVEGIRLLRMVLEQAGWIELDFKQSKTTNEWMIANAQTVLDPKYDHKRFIVFGDKEKTDLLISLFNADLKQLTRTIQQQLKTFSLTENLHGKLVSLLMITQSGAEGLNLRNVRYVYILEPFWNQVRIDQVIGRAIRKGSHLELPEAERNVQVIMYLAKFTPKQIRSNKTLQFRDEGKTTDENVRELALRKDKIIQYFLTLLKMNAIDCIFHADKNKPKQFNYKCYTPAVNIDPKQISYLPNITEDKSTVLFGMQERLKTIKGRAVLYNGNKYVKLETDDKLYDYDAYMTANVLIPVLNL